MSVYVWRNPYQKPRMQHLHDPTWKGLYLAPLCATCDIVTVEEYDDLRRNYAMPRHRDRLTPIDYDHLPMCKRCEKART